MTVQWEDVNGLDFTLPNAPPLLEPPLSLLDEARVLISTENLVARRQALVEQAASAAEQLGADTQDIANNEADSEQDTTLDLRQQLAEWDMQIADLDTQLKLLQEWEHGFQWLPELPKSALGGFTIDTEPAISNLTQGALKDEGNNQTPWGWYDPFILYVLDERSTFGYPAADLAARAARAIRALLAHEPYGAENEFWTGTLVPTNFHLSASPSSPQSSPHRTLAFPFPLPTPTPGTTLGVPESLSDSLASLDQAIAGANAGTGMIHASPYVVQKWMQVYPFIRTNDGFIRTVNNNLIIPGYGYPGTGPDADNRTVTDGVTNSDDTLTSATADFTDSDIGRPVSGDGITAGTVIVAVTSDTAVTLSEVTTATATDVHVTIDGTGGDQTGCVLQWAYATDMVFRNLGDIHTLPAQLREMSPDLTVDNDVPVRAERTHALFTNYLLRAAVLVDTGTP